MQQQIIFFRDALIDNPMFRPGECRDAVAYVSIRRFRERALSRMALP